MSDNTKKLHDLRLRDATVAAAFKHYEMTNWITLPSNRKKRNDRYNNLHLVVRKGFSASLYCTLSVHQLLDASPFVEIAIEDSKTLIRLTKKKTESAYSYSVTTDNKTKCHIGGGQKLIDMGMKPGKYVMVTPLVFRKVVVSQPATKESQV